METSETQSDSPVCKTHETVSISGDGYRQIGLSIFSNGDAMLWLTQLGSSMEIHLYGGDLDALRGLFAKKTGAARCGRKWYDPDVSDDGELGVDYFLDGGPGDDDRFVYCSPACVEAKRHIAIDPETAGTRAFAAAVGMVTR